MNQPKEKLIKLTLTGRYCQLICTLIKEVGNHAFWDATCNFFPVGSNKGTEEEIMAFFMSNLPDMSLLEGGNNLHYGVIQIWLMIKEKTLEIAHCLLSIKGQHNDFLLHMLHHGIIDEWTYQYRWLEADLYKNMYNLINCNQGNLIISNLKNNWSYTFDNNLELICQIIREDLEGEFGVYILPYYQYKAKDIQEISKLKRKEHQNKLSPIEREKLWALIDQNTTKHIWLDRFLYIANALAEKGCSEIKKFLEIHSNILYAINKLQIKSYCDPALKIHKQVSHYCENGVISYGVKPKWKA
ncbi:hypothetical protein [Nostoc cycadae]|uniref:Uncharacterized protein n=1 Tax=Nostoc cycadae WK-1 TaxID=1861711 RepID=A0A2H6LCL5_9NOSO|nr:hypothetical protein [Nostoc cycadae]GBE90959.1 hypothetical protein NCWK1_0679 [Nostoc cycadae WK-1]